MTGVHQRVSLNENEAIAYADRSEYNIAIRPPQTKTTPLLRPPF